MIDSATYRPSGHLAAALGECLARLCRDAAVPDDSIDALRDAVRALVAALADGHTCVPLAMLGGDAERWRTRLLGSQMVASEDCVTPLPLLLDAADRLYLFRYYDYERRLAHALHRLAGRAEIPLPAAEMRALLAKHFERNRKASAAGAVDWQRVAAAVALTHRLAIVSGGPGTGKTTTMIAILTCLLTLQPGLRIAVAAPTGKAAARMMAALRTRAAELDADLRERLPREPFTIHRLLGRIPDSDRFRHDAEHPLALDVLVVDEASMLDLALATRLVEALPRRVRLILVGDKDQLASVEAGAIFAALAADASMTPETASLVAELAAVDVNLLGRAGSAAPLADATVWLRHNFRFDASSALGQLAAAIGGAAEDPAEALALLSRNAPDARFVECDAGPLPAGALAEITAGFGAYFALLAAADPDAEALLTALDRFRVLCAVREGSRGLGAINEHIARHFTSTATHRPAPGSPWFHGRPVMVTRNDYGVRLFNGDVGVALRAAHGAFEVWFPDQDGVRAVAASRLPPHESAFATTVHKAQGSEFERVALVLPSSPSPLLTRELVYTAITRARSGVTIYGTREIFTQAIVTATRRDGGLMRRLRRAASPGTPSDSHR